MSGCEWKPGDVARTGYGLGLVVKFNKIGCNPAHNHYPLHIHYGDGDWGATGDARPLVVIDPATLQRPIKGGDPHYDAAELARTLRLLANHDEGGPYTYRAEIVRELADKIAPVEPPKPDEPTGLGAVVEDAEGLFWLRQGDGRLGAPWYRRNSPGVPCHRTWDELTTVRVLSEGVQS